MLSDVWKEDECVFCRGGQGEANTSVESKCEDNNSDYECQIHWPVSRIFRHPLRHRATWCNVNINDGYPLQEGAYKTCTYLPTTGPPQLQPAPDCKLEQNQHSVRLLNYGDYFLATSLA